MVQSRILERITSLGFDTFSAYLDYLDGTTDQVEIEHFCNALTTNLTSFFRENHHFDHFSNEVTEMKNAELKKLRVWSAGCSTGEEAYSIASLLYALNVPKKIEDTKILATDIDTDVLAKARAGIYDISDLAQISKRLLKAGVDRNENDFQFAPKIRHLIAFKRLNLLQSWPMKGTFEFIFCRNVMIYFSAETKALLISRFAEMLRPGGVLYLGHSETILGDHPLFQSEGNTIYRKIGSL